MKQGTLEVCCKEELIAALSFAVEHDCLPALIGRLHYLATYYEGGKAVLYRDSAPLSFGFALKNANEARGLVGGLIYSGPGQRLDGAAPTFTTSLDDTREIHCWTTHT